MTNVFKSLKAEIGGRKLAGALALVVIFGCGPINEKPSDQGGADSAHCSVASAGVRADDLQVSDGHHFAVTTHSGNVRDGADGWHLADISFRFIRGQDLGACTKSMKIGVQYRHESPHGATHDPYVLQVVRQPDGSFLGTMQFKRGGKFDFTVQVSDEGVQDAYTSNKITLLVQ